MTPRPTSSLLAALALTSALFAAPGSAQEVRISVADTIETLDPHDSTDNIVASVADGMFERLIEFDRDMNMVPGLAESWEANDEATEFTFTLRQGVTFHDGEPFNAEAVKANIDRLANQDNNLKRNSMFRVVESTEVVDEYTFSMTLSEPFGAMFATVAHPSIVMHSPKSLAENADGLNKAPVGTGPFKLTGYVPGDYLTMEKSDDYWREGIPAVDAVRFLTVRETATSAAMLKADELEFIYPMPPELYEELSSDADFEVQAVPGITVWTASMNQFREEFKNPLVREAFNLAIDKNAIVQVVYGGQGAVPDSPLAPNTAFYSAQEAYPHDLERARELMKEAGYEDGFEIDAVGRNTSNETRMLQLLQQMLGQIGVKVNIFPLEAATRSQKLFGDFTPEEQEFDLLIGGWSPSTGDADWHLRPVYSKEGWIPNIYNMAFYYNADVDAAIAKGLSSADDGVRQEAYADAQRMIWEDRPVVWLVNEKKMAVGDTELTGVYAMPDGTMTYSDAAMK